MNFIDNLAIGLGAASTLTNLGFCFMGCLLGTIVGVLPGIGTIATIAILLPATYGLDPLTSLIMLAGIYYGAQYGGSTTAILLNMPGEGSSIVTCLDGYKMAQGGRAGAALAIAALGSLFAGLCGAIIIGAFAPVLGRFAQEFRSPEFFGLMVFGLLSAVILASGSVLKAVAMILLGLLFGLVGQDITSGLPRYTFGSLSLIEGIEFVAVVLGLFGLAEVIKNLERSPGTEGNTDDVRTIKIGKVWPSRSELRSAWPAVLRGTALGSIIGILPGGAAAIASFASYTLEKKVADNPARFGRGAIEGVAGPESANNAASQTSFIPLLTLGIPSNAVMAIMAGALMIQGIAPGPKIITDQPVLFWGLIVSMLIGNIMLVVINLPLIGVWVQLLKVPYRILFPLVVVLSAVGIQATTEGGLNILLLAAFSTMGYLFVKIGCETAPLVLGFVLGPLMEENFRRSMALSQGSFRIFIERPLCVAILIAAAILLVLIVVPSLRRTRDQALQEA